jgi:hypothetical protein
MPAATHTTTMTIQMKTNEDRINTNGMPEVLFRKASFRSGRPPAQRSSCSFFGASVPIRGCAALPLSESNPQVRSHGVDVWIRSDRIEGGSTWWRDEPSMHSMDSHELPRRVTLPLPPEGPRTASFGPGPACKSTGTARAVSRSESDIAATL